SLIVLGMLLLLYIYYTTSFVFFFTDPATTEIYTLSLHDALPISFTPSGGRYRLSRMLRIESRRCSLPRSSTTSVFLPEFSVPRTPASFFVLISPRSMFSTTVSRPSFKIMLSAERRAPTRTRRGGR